MFGDGSDGKLVVSSSTYRVSLNHKYQFTELIVEEAGILSTLSSSGSVLYITALHEIRIDGKLDVSGAVDPGRKEWPVTIDGVTYTSPGVPDANYWPGQSAVNYGFGGGGNGGNGVYALVAGGTPYIFSGGKGASGGPSFGTPGASRSTTHNTPNGGVVNGRDATGGSAGGSGGAWAASIRNSGTRVIRVFSGNSGRGGSSYGANGANGSAGSFTDVSGWGSATYGHVAAGGGGAGGIAGRAGVHVVLRAPKITINGTIITSGTSGGSGGDGGRYRGTTGWDDAYAAAGMGGAGGNGGDIRIAYVTEYANNGVINTSGGAGGSAGYGGQNKAYQPPASASGSTGALQVTQVTDPSAFARTIYPSLASSSATHYQPAVLIAPLVITPAAPVAATTYYGIKLTMSLLAAAPEASTLATYEPEVIQSPPPPPPPTDWTAIGKEDKKVYVYRVYKPDGTYVAVWDREVIDPPEFTQAINTPGTTMTVQLARSANNMRETRSVRITEDGHVRITESGHRRINLSQTPNSVGEGTDVELNYNVDVYAHYGEFRTRVTEGNRVRITEDGHERVTASGAPMGIRIFSGFILDYDSDYGSDSSGVTVTLASHGYELGHALIKDGNKTNVTYSSQPIETTLKSILDTNPGTMTYEAATIDDTGVSIPATFRLNTKLEGIKYLADQTLGNWYWFGHVGENNIYLKAVSNEPDHTFVKGKHIKSLRLKRSLENLVNEVYFVGGETTPGDPASVLFRRYTRPLSIAAWRTGLHRKTDRRYTLATSTQRYADKLLDENQDPAFTTPLTISSARYNIETIKLGQTVAFRNFGNFVDEVLLQIVSLKYTPTAVTVELGTVLERQVDMLSAVEQALDNDQYESIPDTAT